MRMMSSFVRSRAIPHAVFVLVYTVEMAYVIQAATAYCTEVSPLGSDASHGAAPLHLFHWFFVCYVQPSTQHILFLARMPNHRNLFYGRFFRSRLTSV